MAAGHLKGSLLVATPELLDPNFRQTVVLVVEHLASGAVGVVLNRPSESDVSEALPQWSHLTAEPGRFFIGGPVDQHVAMGLCRGGSEAVCLTISGELGSLDLDARPEEARLAGVDTLRIFVGYAGWGVGQLEGEIAEGSWWVVPAQTDDVFSSEAEDLWCHVLARQPLPLRLFARYPTDPHVN